jgi:hypothetical protein
MIKLTSDIYYHKRQVLHIGVGLEMGGIYDSRLIPSAAFATAVSLFDKPFVTDITAVGKVVALLPFHLVIGV